MRDRGEAPANGPTTASPDMTILEAADAMERLHDSKILVERAGRPIGFLTEQDIIEHVLAQGTRPDEVTVWDVMTRTGEEDLARFSRRARLDEAIDTPSFLGGAQIFQGKCEECGVLSVEVRERDGLLICGDCSETLAEPAYS